MATTEIRSGACGFITQVKATARDKRTVELTIQSTCAHISKLAEALHEVDAYKELSCRPRITTIIDAGLKFCPHAACPVPCGIVKTVEVAAGLAVPRDVIMRITADD
jgi:hypothetical protein